MLTLCKLAFRFGNRIASIVDKILFLFCYWSTPYLTLYIQMFFISGKTKNDFNHYINKI